MTEGPRSGLKIHETKPFQGTKTLAKAPSQKKAAQSRQIPKQKMTKKAFNSKEEVVSLIPSPKLTAQSPALLTR
ncbi:hypothetical protein AZI85_15270 [Bdellovibrio bacteriovorus]|uniref:Uncharacterized protein n=1 Tax=Bdellovibrio bacteriovorus TaxID=959 RepID=A0A150WU94_BDEBC|nr:hypothetical protein AZI85_15270 [Bdellovibrio bacteriovorus]